MPPREWRLRIADMLGAIRKVAEYTRNMDLKAFEADAKTIDAVVHNFAILGEAAANLPPAVVEMHPSIPWKTMRNMRNIMIHAYFGVDAETLWDTIVKDLPPLARQLESLLSEST